MNHALYDIWEEACADSGATTRWIGDPPPCWRAQLVNYVGQFQTKESAEGFVAAVKDYRKKNKLK